jgi:hypothetical protein
MRLQALFPILAQEAPRIRATPGIQDVIGHDEWR